LPLYSLISLSLCGGIIFSLFECPWGLGKGKRAITKSELLREEKSTVPPSPWRLAEGPVCTADSPGLLSSNTDIRTTPQIYGRDNVQGAGHYSH
jgi:hypothetical protein